ncbi:MAG: polysaccharide deacetylase family protein [Candidatus Pacebacteria bacterium]|nr:polysaccharide deacetylase family protein [Candidatus Paceibacterota bacterium]
MIIELAGLPATGKSTFAEAVARHTFLPVIHLRSRIARGIFGLLFFILHPRTSYKLCALIKKGALGNKTLERSLLLNACLGAGAKYMYARLRGGVIDQGLVQALISALPDDEADLASIAHHLPMPDLLIFSSTDQSVREKRLTERGRRTREEISEGEATRWEQDATSAYERVRAVLLARIPSTLTLDLSAPDALRQVTDVLPRRAVNTARALGKTLGLILCYVLSILMSPFSKRRHPEVSVLMYHAVNASGWKHAVTPDEFKRQMEYLMRKRTPVSVADVVAYATEEKKLKNGSVAVTFDDGYADFRTTVLPVINALRIPVTLFLTTNLTIHTSSVNPPRLSSEDVAALAQEELVSIESHGRTHRHFNELAPDEVQLELRESMRDIEKMTGKSSRYFAYPYGARSEEVERATHAAGYDASFSITEGFIRPGDNLLRLRRVQVDATMSFTQFVLRTTSALECNRKIVDWLRRV